MEELILKEFETKEALVKLINNSGLPAILLMPMVKEIYEQLEKIRQEQFIQAQKSIESKEEKKDGLQ